MVVNNDFLLSKSLTLELYIKIPPKLIIRTTAIVAIRSTLDLD